MADIREALFHSPLGEDAVHVRRMSGRDMLGRPFEYRVELVRESPLPAIKTAELLGKNVTVELYDLAKKPRYFNGWVSHFERLGVEGRFSRYAVELRPWLWYLNLSSDCKIFQNKSVIEILDGVFETYSHKMIEKRIDGTYRKRAFCVQYRETDLDFVSRLMEEEGLYYHFEHTNGEHKMILCDGPSGHHALRGNKLVWAEGQTGARMVQNLVSSWSRRIGIRSLSYTHSDFDFEAPSTSLLTKAERSNAPHGAQGGLDVYDYPGEYD